MNTQGKHYLATLSSFAKQFVVLRWKYSTKSRHIAIPLLEAELEWIGKMGVVSRVTDGCTYMVVVPKSEGRVCICVDLTRLCK